MSGVSAIYILDRKGRILICRQYKSDLPNNIHEKFTEKLLELDESTIKPIIIDDQIGISFFHKKINNIYFLIVSKRDSNAMMVFQFLLDLIKVFVEYFKELEEESIRDNFVCIYELLDEMMDDGYPQTTEIKILSQFITSEKHALNKKDKKKNFTGFTTDDKKIAEISTGITPHRNESIKYQKNEVFLDVIEKVNMLIGGKGNVIKSEVIGSLHMKACLSGMPNLKLGLNDKLMYEIQGRVNNKRKVIEMNDMKFHPCVHLNKFEEERNIEFVPPDGEFDLITYRLDIQVKPLIMVEVAIENKTSSKIEFFIKVKSNFKAKCIANQVHIFIPVPSDVQKSQFKASIGSAVYNSAKECIDWTIKQFAGHKEQTLKASFFLPSIISPDRENYKNNPVELTFEIPYFTVSGIQVRYLKIVDKSGYHAYPWVRYISKNGDYFVRMGL